LLVSKAVHFKQCQCMYLW